MRMVGKIALWKSLLTAFLFTAIMFVTFDVAFDVIMPKGPLEALFGRSANAVWLDSSLAPDSGVGAERSRFSILADDGGPFGQSVRHSSGRTRVSVGNSTVQTEGGFFRWLDGVWGRRALRAPEGYPCEFTLGWLGYLGYLGLARRATVRSRASAASRSSTRGSTGRTCTTASSR